MKKPALNGFTLVELMVAMTIMVVMGVYVFSNYRSFGEDRKLNNAALDIQNLIRKIQTNATANVKCGGNSTSEWGGLFARFSDTYSIGIYCKDQLGGMSYPYPPDFTLQPGISIERICGNDRVCPSTASCSRTPVSGSITAVVIFASLSGTPSFKGQLTPGSSCFDTRDPLTVILRNSNTATDCDGSNLAKCKALIIEKGGRIYVQ